MVRAGWFSFFLLLALVVTSPAAARECDGGGAHPLRYAIPLFYVTDRNDLGTGAAVHWGKQSDDRQHYGRVLSSITRSCATLPAAIPAWWPPYAEPVAHRADAHFLIHQDTPFPDEAAMLAAMQASLDAFQAAGAPRDVILFLHGYNQSFSEAGRDAAELALGLPFRGVPVFYAWPSQDSVFHYNWDSTRARRAEPHVRELIRAIVDRLHPDHFHIVAHSMGNRTMVEGLLDLSRERSDLPRRITSLTLLSPDLDRQLFERQTAGRLGRIAGRITLFVNRRDRALRLAEDRNGGVPLGLLRGTPLVAPEITTIDISPVSRGLTRHADFEHQAAVMREILAGIADVPIRQRLCLEQVPTAEGPYYRIDPARAGCPTSGAYPPAD
jgi:esterase/lipase superfamily enzyme